MVKQHSITDLFQLIYSQISFIHPNLGAWERGREERERDPKLDSHSGERERPGARLLLVTDRSKNSWFRRTLENDFSPKEICSFLNIIKISVAKAFWAACPLAVTQLLVLFPQYV